MRKRELLSKLQDFIKDIFLGEYGMQKIEKHKSDIIVSIDDTNKKVDNILDFLKEKNKILEVDIKDLSEKNTHLQIKNSSLSKEVNESNQKIDNLNIEIKDLKTTIQNLEYEKDKQVKDIDKLRQDNNDIKEKYDKNVKALKDFENIFYNEKLIKLLEAILNNSALQIYKDEIDIDGKNPKSIYNLLQRVLSPKLFIDSYYDSLKEYKKTYQNKMDDNEIKFYQVVNEYFSEEVILDFNKKIIDEDFDKSKHKGINNEKKGEIDSGIVLIPADTINHDKVIVKLK